MPWDEPCHGVRKRSRRVASFPLGSDPKLTTRFGSPVSQYFISWRDANQAQDIGDARRLKR